MVDVLGGSADDPVRDQRVAAAEREPVLARRPQCDRGHVTVELVNRHDGSLSRMDAVQAEAGCRVGQRG
jgi:hypothetical protein